MAVALALGVVALVLVLEVVVLTLVALLTSLEMPPYIVEASLLVVAVSDGGWLHAGGGGHASEGDRDQGALVGRRRLRSGAVGRSLGVAVQLRHEQVRRRRATLPPLHCHRSATTCHSTSGPDFPNILRQSYDHVKVTIDLRRTSNLCNVLRLL